MQDFPLQAPLLLLATDVFGHTPAIDALVRQLSLPCIVISPHAQPQAEFKNEPEAYQAFLATGGVARYASQLAAALAEHAHSLRFTLGFSAGASALWLNSASPCMENMQSSVLFYGSRIRDHAHIQPQHALRLIFAEQEAAFEPASLVAKLRAQDVNAELVKHSQHGFMNPYSRGFDLKLQERFVEELSEHFKPPQT